MKKQKVNPYAISTVLCLMLASTTVAQGVWTTYTEEDGLCGNYIQYIAIDNNNVKWFGSWSSGGVSSFDGISWTTYSQELNFLEDEYGIGVSSITVDNDNVKWFTRQGVISYDGIEWKSYPVERMTGYDKDASIWDSAVDSNNVKWFCKGEDLVSFDGQDWKSFQTDAREQIMGIDIDSLNVIWFISTVGATSDPGVPQLYSFDGSDCTTIPMDPALFDYSIYGGQSIAVDRDDVIWIGTWKGVFSYDGDTWRSYPESPLTGRTVWSIAVDANNTKWFTGYPGVTSYDGVTWKQYTTVNGLVDDRARVVAIDNDGVKWVGTTNGVSSYDDRPLAVETGSVPAQVAIIGNYPNPFNPFSTISYEIPEQCRVLLEIFNLAGQRVATLVDGIMPFGTHEAQWRTSTEQAAGVYLCRLNAGGQVRTAKMLYLK